MTLTDEMRVAATRFIEGGSFEDFVDWLAAHVQAFADLHDDDAEALFNDAWFLWDDWGHALDEDRVRHELADVMSIEMKAGRASA